MRGGEIAASSGDGRSPLIAMSTICSATRTRETSIRRVPGWNGMDRADDGEDGQFGIYAAQAAIPHTVLYHRDEARVEFATACLDEATVLLAQSAGLVDDAASSQLFADRGRVSRQDGSQSLCAASARAAGLECTLRNAQRELMALEKDLLFVPHVIVEGAFRHIQPRRSLAQ